MHLKINHAFLYLYRNSLLLRPGSSFIPRTERADDYRSYRIQLNSSLPVCSPNIETSYCHNLGSLPPLTAMTVFSWADSAYERRLSEGHFPWGTPNFDLWTSGTNQSWPNDFPGCTINLFNHVFLKGNPRTSIWTWGLSPKVVVQLLKNG